MRRCCQCLNDRGGDRQCVKRRRRFSKRPDGGRKQQHRRACLHILIPLNGRLKSDQYRHQGHDHLRPCQGGYRLTDLDDKQLAFIATPEKALLDLIHLRLGGDSPDYLRELRLQNVDRLEMDKLQRQADLAHSPKLCQAANAVIELARSEEYTAL